MIYAFDNYRLNTDTRELTRGGDPVAVEPQTFALLQALIESRETVVSKQDLADAVWRGRFTSDATIASRIKSARQALDDDGKAQRYIKTVHGVGYRFVGALHSSAIVLTDNTSAINNDPVIEPVDSRPTILVSPFEGIQQPPSIVASGLTHDVIVGLSRLRWLKVISWASARRLQGRQSDDLRPLTAADYCLSGLLEPAPKGLSLTVQLTDLRDNSIVWAERFASSSGDINELRTEVVQQALVALELQLSAAEAAKAKYLHTEDMDAWSNYHLGLLHMYRFNARNNAIAIAHFEKAVARQPEFARAHAGLSFAYFQAAFNRFPGIGPDRLSLASGASAQRAVELDGLDPQSNFVMGRSFWLTEEVASGQPWLERALLLSGNFAQAQYSHGLANLLLGESGTGATDMDGHTKVSTAIALSPLDPFMYGFMGARALMFLRDGELEQARIWANRAARQPNAIAASDLIAAAANGVAGETEEAARWARRAQERSENLDGSYFFRVLPFSDSPLRTAIEKAFVDIGLNAAEKT